MFPVEYLVAEMFWWQRIIEAKRSHPDNSWAGEHMTGSRAEGLNIPLSILKADEREISFLASDLDIMIVKKPFEIKGAKKIPIFSVEYDENDPRYVSLRLTEEYKRENETSRNSVFLNHLSFFSPTMYGQFRGFFSEIQETKQQEETLEELIPDQEHIHGPARKVGWWINNCNFLPMDKAEVFEHPKPEMEWLHRERVWPSPEVVQQIRDCGCHLAPVGRGKRAPDTVKSEGDFADAEAETFKQNQESEGERTMDETEWRMSFSLVENILGQSLSPMQRHVMVLLKIIKEKYLSDHGVISTYHLKNLLFWECENKEIDFWTEDNSGACVLLMMDRLEESLRKRHLPHYIMPKSDLLQYEDPDKLEKAAEAVRVLRKNILKETLNALSTLQVATFQSRRYFNDLNEFEPNSLSKFQVSMCTLYQVFIDKYKEVIGVELRRDRSRDYETIKQKMTSAVNSVLSLIDVSGEWISEIIVDAFGLPRDSSSSNLIVDSELTLLSDAAELQRVFDFWNEMQTAMVETLEAYKTNVFEHLLSYFPKERDNLRGDTNANAAEPFATYCSIIPLMEKVKLMFSSHNKDMVDNNVRNLIDLYFSTISSLRLFIHESILARIYCKLWFAKFDRDQSKDREAFRCFVCKDIESCPLDEDFMALSLTFFDKMIEGKDACQIIPETLIMEKVKKIQETKADETVSFSKKLRSWIRNKLVEISKDFEEIASVANRMDDNCNIM